MKSIKVFYPVGIENIWHHNADNTNRYRLDGIEKLVRLKSRIDKDRKFKVINVSDADIETLKSIHSIDYIESLKTGSPLNLVQTSGLIWQESLAQAFANCAKSVTLACKDALLNRASVALSSGGHHAIKSRGYGLNPISEVAIAIENLHKENPDLKIVVLDLDIHAGNGFQNLLQNKKNITVYDLWSKSISEWDIPLYATNIKSYKVDTLDEYKICLENTLNEIKDLNPDLVIYHSGADVVQTDRLGGISGFTKDDFEQRELKVISTILHLKIPIAVVLGGGYVKYTDANQVESLREKLVDLHYYTFKLLTE